MAWHTLDEANFCSCRCSQKLIPHFLPIKTKHCFHILSHHCLYNPPLGHEFCSLYLTLRDDQTFLTTDLLVSFPGLMAVFQHMGFTVLKHVYTQKFLCMDSTFELYLGVSIHTKFGRSEILIMWDGVFTIGFIVITCLMLPDSYEAKEYKSALEKDLVMGLI